MRHLTVEQLVDLAEGAEAESSTDHLHACGECQRRIADLRGVMSAAADVEAPDPSPLFWEHFSARVRNAVDSERGLSELDRFGVRWAAGARLANWFGIRGAAVCASLVVLFAVALVVGGVPFSSTPAPFEPASLSLEAANDTASSAEDPSLSLVADLAADLDWEAVRDAGLTIHVGVDDEALELLTSGERGELRRLLQGELSPSRRGA